MVKNGGGGLAGSKNNGGGRLPGAWALTLTRQKRGLVLTQEWALTRDNMDISCTCLCQFVLNRTIVRRR